MTYRVEVLPRAGRDLRRIYRRIQADYSQQAKDWFNNLEALIRSLDEQPSRGAATPERPKLRQVLHGHKPHVYRVIYTIDEQAQLVSVLHIRHGAQGAFTDLSPTTNG